MKKLSEEIKQIGKEIEELQDPNDDDEVMDINNR